MLSNGTDSERLPFVLKKLEQVEAAYIKLESQLADRDAEIERLRADLVWAVEMGNLPLRGHDGTPDLICRAVREARDDE